MVAGLPLSPGCSVHGACGSWGSAVTPWTSIFQPKRETESVHGKGDGPPSPRTTGVAGQAPGPQGVALARGEAVAGTARGGVLLQGSDHLQTASFFQFEVELQVAKLATPVFPTRD